jgi:glycosyltransferase involved in cell wall biosynthesis
LNITVIICTYNRSQSLAKTLESVAASTLPGFTEWEVLVADNNSKDQTREVINGFCGRYPGRFRYVFEPRQGKSHALNTAIREAKGEILAFTDDDVTVEPAWLQNLTANLHGNEWAGAGGKILPAQTFTPPRWMSLEGPYSLGGALCGLFDRGDAAGELDLAPHGANMAFRKAMFDRHGGFRTDLGPPPREIQGEDTEFGWRLIGARERLRYEPSAVVRHPVLEERLNQKYFLAWWFDYGRGVARQKSKQLPVWGIPRSFVSISNRILHLLPVRALRWIRASNPQWRFWCKCWVWMTAGEIVEILRSPFGAARQAAGSNCESRSGNGGNP